MSPSSRADGNGRRKAAEGPEEHEGQRVSRRSVFAGLSSVGLAGLVAACGGSTSAGSTTTATSTTGASVAVTPQTSTSSAVASQFAGSNVCTLTASTTQGPYYFDADKVRSDIREDREGTTLRVALKVQDSETCKPLSDAVVEIWHCDAAGIYSGAEALSSGGTGGGAPPSGGGAPPSGSGTTTQGASAADLTPQDDKRYLRGAQVTDADGVVQFTTIWPGWYRGRTVHIHVMVHVSNARVLTSQLMVDEALNTEVFAAAPYASHTGRDTFNSGDGIYQDSMLMKVTKDGDGYLGSHVLAADSDRDGT
jgi:protocatechuate 3,4-dioxygenase beta subunit